MLSKSDNILMSLNSKQSHFANWQPQNSYPKETKKRVTPRKSQKHVWVWCFRIVVLSLSHPAARYFLAWWLLQQLLKRKVFFKIQKN